MKKNKILMKSTFLFLLMVLFAFIGNAQNKTITGKVTDQQGQVLPGVTVVIKGTTQGVITDVNGSFSIPNVPEDALLQFSFVGMKTQDVAVAGTSVLNTVLEEDIIGMDEVVVVGYGSQKKSDITGAVASLPQERLQMVPNTNVAQALQGSVAGVSVTNNSSSAEGNDVSILIRGRNSISANNTPLIVIDGMPYSGSLSDISPTDIESLEVLKDASSAAIYGARGSNGVILITTKKGKDGKVRFNYDGYYGFQQAANIPAILTPDEFYDYKNYREPGEITPSEEALYQSGGGTDWLDLALRTGNTMQHNLSVSGGTDKMKYYLSGSFLDVEGIAAGDQYQRSTLRINLESSVTHWLKLGTNTQLSYSDKSGRHAQWAGDGGAYYMNPLSSSHDENNNLTIYPWVEDVFFPNPLQNTLAEEEDHSYKVVSNIYFDVDLPFITGLTYRLNTGIEYTGSRRGTYWGRDTKTGLEKGGQAETRNDLRTNMLIENILNYKRDFGKHSLFATGLYSFQDYTRDDHDLDSQGFPNDVLTWYQANVAALVEPSYDYSNTTIISSMLRLNYSYDSKYMLTLTGRRDGFSGFGKDNKYGNFYSTAGAWNIHNESFMEDSFFNTLKLRASYGSNGNQAVGAYETLSRLRERSYLDGSNSAAGYIPSVIGNNALRWESTSSFNVGIDYGFLDNKIRGSIEGYMSNTSDLLLDRTISPIHGLTEITENVGETKNQGIELSVFANAISTADFSWEINGNVSYNRNEIVNLHGDKQDDVGSGWFIGEPIRIFYAYEYDGVYQIGDDIENSAQPDAQPGYAKIVDQLTVDTNDDGIPDEADGEINPDDRIILGQRDPSVLASLSMNFKYKNFGLNIMSQGAFGALKQNSFKTDDVWGGVRRNTANKNWWTEDNPTNEYYSNHIDANVNGVNFYESRNYWRIKDITLSYDINSSVLNKLRLDKIRIYATGRNLLTVTDFGGLDPELSSTRDIPLQKTYTLGVNVIF